MKKPKVLLMIDWDPRDKCYLAEHLNRHSVQCDVIGSDFYVLHWNPWKKIVFHWTKCFEVSWRAFLKRREYDYIIALQQMIGMFYGFFKVLTFSKYPRLFILQIDLIQRSNPISAWLRKSAVQIAWMGADRLGFYSNKQLEVMIKNYHVPVDKAVVLYFALQLEKYPYQEKRDRGGYIFSVGVSYRDYKTLFQAARKINRQFVVVTQDFAIQGLTIPENVKVYTNTFGKQASALMQKADVVVIPMRDPESPSGNTSLFEAMWYGKPVVITRAVTTEEYIEDGVDGFLVPCGDADAVAKILNALYFDPERAKKVGKAARKTIQEKFTMDIYAKRIAEIIRSDLHSL